MPSSSPRWLVILNESAGSASSSAPGTDLAATIRDAFAAEGVEADVEPFRPDGLRERVRRAAADGYGTVVAAGGDGTVNALANAMGDDVAFAVLPLGTHNHFAKELRVPLELPKAVAALARGRAEPLDVAELEGRRFLNFSAIGFHPHVVAHRDEKHPDPGRWKPLATALSVVRAVFRLPLVRVRLEADGRPPLRRITPSVIVCTNPHQMAVFGLADVSYPDRGLLNVYVARSTRRLGVLWLMVRALFRRLGDARRHEALVYDDVTVDAGRRRVRVSVDGEVTDLRSPFRYRVRRGALRVVRPPAAS